MQTIWRRERRLPAQPALFKLERKWPYIQHASKLPLPRRLSLSFLFSSARAHKHTHTHKNRRFQKHICTLLCTLTSTEVRGWPLVRECVCYSNIMFLYITVALLSLLLLLQSGRLGAILDSENKRSAEGRKLPTKRDWKMKERAKGRREGQRFPSTAIHDLILFRSAETFPGMRICCEK